MTSRQFPTPADITGSYRPEDIDLREGAGVAVHSLEDLHGLKMSPFVRRAICTHLLPGMP